MQLVTNEVQLGCTTPLLSPPEIKVRARLGFRWQVMQGGEGGLLHATACAK